MSGPRSAAPTVTSGKSPTWSSTQRRGASLIWSYSHTTIRRARCWYRPSGRVRAEPGDAANHAGSHDRGDRRARTGSGGGVPAARRVPGRGSGLGRRGPGASSRCRTTRISAASPAPHLTTNSHVTVRYDRIPKGEVELRRASAVHSSDGHHLGHVDGFVVDDQEHITHIVLERGHLWGKREIAIPVRGDRRDGNRLRGAEPDQG